MPTIWLIRHGQSIANAGLATLDPESIGLTAQGQQQAAKLATAFPAAPTLVITSRYRRAQETAAPTLRRFPGVAQETWPVEEFTYLAPGRCVNTTVRERQPWVLAFWERCDPSYSDGPGAESFVLFMQRVQGVWERLVRNPSGFTTIFSHEQFLHALLWALLRGSFAASASSMTQFRAFLLGLPFPNGGIVPIRVATGQHTWIGPIATEHL